MIEHFTDYYFSLELLAFFAVIFMHIVKTNRNLIRAYLLQSLVVVIILIGSGLEEGERSLIWIGLLTFAIKVVLAPLFFTRLKKRFEAFFTPNNYLSMPLTLATIMVLIVFAYSNIFQSLNFLFPVAPGLLPLSLSLIFIAVFLMINHRGAFSQMIGILALENSIVLLAIFIGIKQPFALEIGIIFDLVIWMIIAQVFITMIHKQFGSLNVTQLKKLKEE